MALPVKGLSAEFSSILDRLCRFVEEPLYLVGGPVRDLLLGKKILDMDCAVSGRVEPIAEQLTRDGAKVVFHERFGTAKIILPGGREIDIASTRKEQYPDPARLPVVELGAGIEEDLGRRDFSVNAMAMRLNGPDAGKIIDPHGGQADLRTRRLRILHPESFKDDPVRAFRAFRYACRYSFHIEKGTMSALLDLVKKHPDLIQIASDRIFDEWRRTFEEACWIENIQMISVKLMPAWLGTRPILDVKVLREVERNLARLRRIYPDLSVWMARCITFLATQPAAVRQRATARMPFPRAVKKIFSVPVDLHRALKSLNARKVIPSRVFQELSALPPEWLVALYAIANTHGRKAIDQFASRWRKIPPPADGDDLKRAGIPPGPAYPKILKCLHAARLDGRLKTAKQLSEAIRKYLPRSRSA